MQRKGFVFLMFCLCGMPMGVFAADLLADEQGPTAPEAVAAVTADEDFLLPSYVVPGDNTLSLNTPASVPSEVDILNEIFGTPTPLPAPTPQVNRPVQHTFSPRTGVQSEGGMPLLTPLPPLPVIQNEPVIEAKKPAFKQTGYADQALAMATSTNSGLGMPREIRITFYSGQSTFSAQALKWAKSFAVRVVNQPTLLAEIRVSDQNWPVQEKRLAVLLQILKETGVSAHQIRLYKTGREENTILMGYTNNPDYTTMENRTTLKERVQKTIDW